LNIVRDRALRKRVLRSVAFILALAGGVGTTIPFRVDVGLRLSDHLWVAPS
jgi:hypothetical protein